VEGRLFIELSTVSSGTHAPIAAAAASRAASFIECPVSGSISTARLGALVGFAGGGAAEIARAIPLLKQFCRRVDHVGPLGAGARMKLAANLMLAVFWQALGESLLLLEPSDLDPERAIDLLANSNIGASILRIRASEIVAALQGNASDAVAFDVDMLRKDLRYMAHEASARGNALPLANCALHCFDAASRDGGGGVDSFAYPAYWIERHKATRDRMS
jgi:3-hydroxyisobutyrate dehydrogenase